VISSWSFLSSCSFIALGSSCCEELARALSEGW
jgi:hypothetical protein